MLKPKAGSPDVNHFQSHWFQIGFATLHVHPLLYAEVDIDSLLLESGKVWEANVGAGVTPLLEELWQAINDVICLIDCDVYTYKAVSEGDPFCDEGNLWSFNYFFYNR